MLVGCASSAPVSRADAEPACGTEAYRAKLAHHEERRITLSEAMHEARSELDQAQRELEAAATEEAREAASARVGDLEGTVAVHFTQADKHYFAAKEMTDRCP